MPSRGRVWLCPTPTNGKLKNDVVLGGLSIGEIKWGRMWREVFFQHRYRHSAKSAFSEIIRIQPKTVAA
jgi:hypothetical protein